jgi:hypothetical protein
MGRPALTDTVLAPWLLSVAARNGGENVSGKQTAAMVLGIVGGVFGIFGASLVMATGGIGALLEQEGAALFSVLGTIAMFLAVLGIVGGALAKSQPRTAAWCMGLSGVLGFGAALGAWFFAGPLLIVGAVLAYTSRPKPMPYWR